MSDALEKAKKFLAEERAFRLGDLLTESFHPKTLNLSQTARADLPAAVRLLQSVDDEIPPLAKKALARPVFARLADAFYNAIAAGRRIFFTGCGATGRLSILLEAAWRRFFRNLPRRQPDLSNLAHKIRDRTFSVMAGGDFALIKSVEGFEDFPDFGRYQLARAGVGPNDVVVAITEGGETPFVIATAWHALDAGANVFFVYNNPTDLLRRHVRRSRRVIEESRIRKIDLTTGPMAITGSTRMQATTSELLVVAAALESALIRFLGDRLTEDIPLEMLGLTQRTPRDYHTLFVDLLSQLAAPKAVDAMARLAEYEETIYRAGGLLTYAADSMLLDVLTDTTERSPTFMLPAFRKSDDQISPRSWSFVKDPFRPTPQAWTRLLERKPRGLRWGPAVYDKLNAPDALRACPPKLDNSEIFKFRIGAEPDPSRTDAPDSALVAIGTADEVPRLIAEARRRFGAGYRRTAAVTIGPPAPVPGVDDVFEFECSLAPSPLRLWHHLAAKLILNTVSTATMVRMDRVLGNAMVWLSPSNKKLIDRGSRLVSHTTGCSYEDACIELHKAIEEIEQRAKTGEQVPSPVALAIERIRAEPD
jgi:N-acetylmuramic acid 6-phosphate etherase